jgi:hypothetical protein
MTFPETLSWQATQWDKINRLADLGDALARRLVVAYHELYADRLNPYLQSEWQKIADDYCRRDLTVVTRVLLQDRFGHKLPYQLRRLDS